MRLTKKLGPWCQIYTLNMRCLKKIIKFFNPSISLAKKREFPMNIVVKKVLYI
jgi:hypothetical protein